MPRTVQEHVPCQPGPHQSVSYHVDTVGEAGGTADAGELQAMLALRAYDGWTLKATVEASMKGPGETEGLILIFERPLYLPSELLAQITANDATTG